ncbi:MAG: flagellar biosynthetic protein FliO [Fibrobacteres bacterium]|nr:flagellar biosynthetic protein FliO [Fibrobacterota bacterium]
MTRARAVFAFALLGASLSVLAGQPRSLYAAPARASAANEAAEAPASSASEPSAPTPAMEEKFRKLQQEMQSNPAAAPPTSGAQAPAADDGRSVGGIALQILFGLAFVLLLAVVSIRVLKRLQGRLLTRPGPGGDLLEVLETCHLGPQQKVVAIRMHDEISVLGVSKEGIRLLTVLKHPAEEIRQARQGGNPAAFSDNLNKLLERFKKPKKVSDLLDEAQA